MNGRSVVVKVSQTAGLTDGSIESFSQSDSGYAIQSDSGYVIQTVGMSLGYVIQSDSGYVIQLDSGYVIRVCHSVRQWVSHNVIRSFR